ncbi:MAG: PorV/PorQ family protein, partial [Elusimicrobia bacterium]|nr:PorV/PorQ family protein [Elusimicrobiota bacterium]
NNPKKDWLNEIVYLLSRPWALGVALVFVLMPSGKLTDALESGAEFLKIDTDAKAGAMSSAGAASAMGISAITYNPAGIASIGKGEAALSHSAWYLGSAHDFMGAGFALPGSAGWKMGLSFTRLSSGSMEGRTASRSKAGGYSAYDQAASLALARQYGVYSVGGAVKYIESSIAGVKGTGYAVDMGLKRGLRGVPMSVGVAVQNLGPGIKYISQRDQLPLSVSAGIMFMPVQGFMLNFDARRYVYDKYTTYSLGTEYALFGGPGTMSGLSLRGGVNGGAGQGAAGAFSAGAGIKLMNADLDYAMSPEGRLGSTQRITLKKKF